jgi:hypothetical protein
MLGLNAEGEDNYLKAQGMSSSWKRRLFLLMEEPGSSREAFALHVFSTSGILFRYEVLPVFPFLSAFLSCEIDDCSCSSCTALS